MILAPHCTPGHGYGVASTVTIVIVGRGKSSGRAAFKRALTLTHDNQMELPHGAAVARDGDTIPVDKLKGVSDERV